MTDPERICNLSLQGSVEYNHSSCLSPGGEMHWSFLFSMHILGSPLAFWALPLGFEVVLQTLCSRVVPAQDNKLYNDLKLSPGDVCLYFKIHRTKGLSTPSAERICLNVFLPFSLKVKGGQCSRCPRSYNFKFPSLWSKLRCMHRWLV